MSLSTTDQVAALIAVLFIASCRFGGPSGDATLLVVDGAAGVAGSGGQAGSTGSGGAGGSGAGSGSAGSGGTSGEGGGSNPGGSAGAMADASVDIMDDGIADGDVRSIDVQGDADAAEGGASADTGPPTVCAPPFSSVICDPVCNTGCPALFRCDITDTPRTGVCVGTLLSPNTEGMACTRSLATDDCVERLSCVAATCRRLCYRDADCTTAGTCCNTSLEVDAGPLGYQICSPCLP